MEARGRFHLVALALTSSTGGGMRIAPGADARDGAFDWVAVGDVGRRRLLWNFPRIYAGTHLTVPGITSGRTRNASFHSPVDVPLNIDGEPLGTLPARFEVLPEALPFLLP
jgi:diacylglycerol kinase (ATP)